jgi:hypothetical protein
MVLVFAGNEIIIFVLTILILDINKIKSKFLIINILYTLFIYYIITTNPSNIYLL